MKIVVFGASGAGKSSFVRAVGETKILNTDRGGTTIALDYTTIHVMGIKIALFGVPGKIRFKTIREILLEGSDGILFLVDATDPSKDTDAKTLLYEVRKISPTVPLIICVNKIDSPDARDPVEVINSLELPPTETVISISVKENKNIFLALKKILLYILVRVTPFFVALDKYNKIKGGLDKAIEELKGEYSNIAAAINYYALRGAIDIDWESRTYSINENILKMVFAIDKLISEER